MRPRSGMRKSPGSRPSEMRPNNGVTIARITSAKNNVTSHFTMIELFTWTTPNGRKISIMLEECGLPYEVHPVNIGRGEQFAPEFVAICPNSKIPAIVDRDGGVSLFESGAILIYLAEKTGTLLPSRNPARAKVMEW